MNPTQQTVLLPRTSNQALGLARHCRDFLKAPRSIGAATLERLGHFHLDSVGCGVSAIAEGANAPTVLREIGRAHV